MVHVYKEKSIIFFNLKGQFTLLTMQIVLVAEMYPETSDVLNTSTFEPTTHLMFMGSIYIQFTVRFLDTRGVSGKRHCCLNFSLRSTNDI